jgi:hypothetical protein
MVVPFLVWQDTSLIYSESRGGVDFLVLEQRFTPEQSTPRSAHYIFVKIEEAGLGSGGREERAISEKSPQGVP